ncbi:MAG: hypothetical protein KDA22_01335, partial [Phycisphaerales bacterium]|nr:hypothetical protein [Phycisphaerales bacterium]
DDMEACADPLGAGNPARRLSTWNAWLMAPEALAQRTNEWSALAPEAVAAAVARDDQRLLGTVEDLERGLAVPRLAHRLSQRLADSLPKCEAEPTVSLILAPLEDSPAEVWRGVAPEAVALLCRYEAEMQRADPARPERERRRIASYTDAVALGLLQDLGETRTVLPTITLPSPPPEAKRRP